MDSNVIVALIGAAGSLLGAAFGVIASSKLVTYRLEQLENKVNKHNSVIERTYILETKFDGLDNRVQDLERKD